MHIPKPTSNLFLPPHTYMNIYIYIYSIIIIFYIVHISNHIEDWNFQNHNRNK